MADVRETELVLAQGVFAYVLDNTKGHVNTLCGPIKQSLSNTDQLVTLDGRTNRFVAAPSTTAIQSNILAKKGEYIVLTNPHKIGQHPEPGKAEVMPIGSLKMGETENLPGPQSFPLWPGQTAKVIKGHHLRSNQYLIARVYDEDAAKKNWNSGVVKLAAESTEEAAQEFLGIDPEKFHTGQLLIIKGVEVSFFIPPTGVEVLAESDGIRSETYVVDAATLERLEYCILLEENGKKRYVRGPDVVFPTPTETFVVKDGARKFRAYELTEISGIHVKVIADYEEFGQKHRAGDELFITGKEQAIYYPREEHAIITYGDKEMYHAVAIPAGEARYVLNRLSGGIELVTGPTMFLPDPRKQVVVRRILTDKECELYFPGNEEVKSFNRSLRGAAENDSVGYVDATISASLLSSNGFLDEASASYGSPMRDSHRSLEAAGKASFGDSLKRSASFTPPRSITLNTKFEGAVRIDVWPGHAIQVVNRKGDRRIEVGPKSVLLSYDEYLGRMALSTGKPKTTDRLLHTVFLQVMSNAVTDIIQVKTADMVDVGLKIKYLVRFDDSAKDRWFSVDNYVKYMCDHMRSLIGNHVRSRGVQDFYKSAAEILRDLILGDKVDGKRPLKTFEENGMTIYDVELISIQVVDQNISALINSAQQETLKNSIELERAVRNADLLRGKEAADRAVMAEKENTQKLKDAIEAEYNDRVRERTEAATQHDLDLKKQRAQNEVEVAELRSKATAVALKDDKAARALNEEFEAKEHVRELERIAKEAEADVARAEAVTADLVAALTAIAQSGSMEAVAQHLAPLAIVRDQSLSGVLNGLLAGTPMAGMLENLQNLALKSKGVAVE